MSRWRDALFGEFRVSLPRTLAARRPTRITASRGFAVHHPERITLATPDARLRLGTHEFGFARGDQGGLLRVDGELELRGNVQVGVGAGWVIGENGRMSIGARTYFSPNTRVVAMNSISIGDDCAISWDVQLLDEDFHEVIVGGEIRSTSGPISIGNHVWIGSRATVLKGAVIPDDTAVAAGAVVSGRFTEPGTVLAGCPARPVRKNVVWT
ncbi:acyltransferase [Actinomycetospora endophytica]|uniref:Acyltransferase n=1 Tax=Actinomycetospora endophytica TaxID=2291215 RepID=A0ABS8PAY1_9PSEU|nr:acyltransferase [Actinomycetospora endophytica]MCD2195405.1 acyltransferase [Actinomycetospora endophytica]